MSDTESNLHIRWKGVVSGPYSRPEIEEMLARGEISLLHAIEVSGRWTSVGQYVKRVRLRTRPNEEHTPAHRNPPVRPETLPPEVSYSDAGDEDEEPEVAPPDSKPVDYDKLIQIGYILCGATFVLPLLATIPAGIVALRLRAAGFHEPAKLQLLLCGTFTLFGFFFWVLLICLG